MRRMNAHAREPPHEDVVGAFAPFDDLPGLLGALANPYPGPCERGSRTGFVFLGRRVSLGAGGVTPSAPLFLHSAEASGATSDRPDRAPALRFLGRSRFFLFAIFPKIEAKPLSGFAQVLCKTGFVREYPKSAYFSLSELRRFRPSRRINWPGLAFFIERRPGLFSAIRVFGSAVWRAAHRNRYRPARAIAANWAF